jgi:hypothetical protein
MYYVELPFVLQPLGFGTREFLACVRRPFVVAGEQDDEAAGVLDPVVHRPDEARAERDVVVLDEHFVVRRCEGVGNLLRGRRDRAAPAEEKSNLSATAPGIGPVSRRRGRRYGKDWTARARAIGGDRVSSAAWLRAGMPVLTRPLFAINDRRWAKMQLH